MDAYRKKLTGIEALYAVKKYRLHKFKSHDYNMLTILRDMIKPEKIWPQNKILVGFRLSAPYYH